MRLLLVVLRLRLDQFALKACDRAGRAEAEAGGALLLVDLRFRDLGPLRRAESSDDAAIGAHLELTAAGARAGAAEAGEAAADGGHRAHVRERSLGVPVRAALGAEDPSATNRPRARAGARHAQRLRRSGQRQAVLLGAGDRRRPGDPADRGGAVDALTARGRRRAVAELAVVVVAPGDYRAVRAQRQRVVLTGGDRRRPGESAGCHRAMA